MSKNRTTTNYIIGTITLLIGGLIYLFFRQDILALQYIFNSEWLKSINIKINHHSIFIDCLIYNLPDALWYYSLLSFMIAFYDKSIINRVLFIIAVLLPFIWESLQYFRIISGTYDNIDITFYLITLIIFLCLQKKLNH